MPVSTRAGAGRTSSPDASRTARPLRPPRTPARVPGPLTPIASSAPTAARPPARPRACHSKIAAAGDLRGQRCAQHRARASHAPHGDRGEKYRLGQCPHNPTPLSPSVSSSWCSRSRPDRASRRTSASAPDTLCANLASAASRSPGLRQRGQHELRHVGLAGRGRAVPPGTAVPFSAREPFLRQPVKHRHHCGVSQALGEPVADLSYRQR